MAPDPRPAPAELAQALQRMLPGESTATHGHELAANAAGPRACDRMAAIAAAAWRAADSRRVEQAAFQRTLIETHQHPAFVLDGGSDQIAENSAMQRWLATERRTAAALSLYDAARAQRGRGEPRLLSIAGSEFLLQSIGSGPLPPIVLGVMIPDGGGTVSKADTMSRFGLTSREADVALLLAERVSNAEVAKRLRLSPHTARHHTERVLAKLGVTSRRAAADLIRIRTTTG